METRDSKELLQEFNQKYSLNVPIVEKTNFFGDLFEEDAQEWRFFDVYKHEYLNNIGIVDIEEIGFFRIGNYFKQYGQEGFTLVELHQKRSIYPISKNMYCRYLYRNHYKQTNFSPSFVNSSDKDIFERWWIDDLSIIKSIYQDKAEQIERLITEKVNELRDIATNKNYKKGWIYHTFVKAKLDKLINGEILNDTCFYYDPIIYFNLLNLHG